MKQPVNAVFCLVATLLIILSIGAGPSPEKEYVCLPCGRSCDGEVYKKPGVCPSCMMTLVEKPTVTFKNISFLDVCNRLKTNSKDVLLLDCRSKQEFTNTTGGDDYGKFKNAININIDELDRRVGEIEKWKDKEVIVYCSHSHRSPQASYFLVTHGFKNVKNIRGGVSVLGSDPAKDCLKDQFVFYPSK